MVGLMDFFTGGDPEQMAQIDPRYGVPRSDVRDAAVNALANISATLLAAGQPIMPAQRAQLLSQLGGAASGVNTDLYNASQRRLMGAQMEQRRSELEDTRRLGELMRDPAAFQQATGFPLTQFAGMDPRTVSQVLRQVRTQQLTQDPNQRALTALQLRDAQNREGIITVGDVAYRRDPATGNLVALTQRRPQGGQAGEDRALINAALRDPSVAETPEYLTAFNALYGPRQVTAWNPQTQQMEYQWVRPPIDEGIPLPRFRSQQAVPPAAASGGAAPATPSGAPSEAAPPAAAPAAAAMPPPGGATPIIAQRPQGEQPLNEMQAKATGFATRMVEAARVVDPMDFTSASRPGVTEMVLPEFAANFLRSPDRQRYRQAQENWVRANLRMESGAVIGAEEMQKEIENYFPRPGDTPEVIERKRQSREAAMRAMIASAGPGAQRAGIEFRPYEPTTLDRIRSASPQDLLQMDTTNMNARERAEYLARLRQSNRGR